MSAIGHQRATQAPRSRSSCTPRPRHSSGGIDASLTEAARPKGGLRTHPEVTAFVSSGLIGLADILVRGWIRRVSKKALVTHIVTALAEQARDPF